MRADDALDALARHYGVLDSYQDMSGQIRLTSPDTKLALLRANGLPIESQSDIQLAYSDLVAARKARICTEELIVAADTPAQIALPEGSTWRLDFQDDTTGPMEGHGSERTLLPQLPAGIHSLSVRTGRLNETITLIAAPSCAPRVSEIVGHDKVWGLNTALYGLRSERNFGLGDFEDLARIAETAGQVGASFVGINPIHAMGTSETEIISPYSPSHRGFLNTSHIALDHVPGLSHSSRAKSILSGAKRPDNFLSEAFVDYTSHRSAFLPILSGLYDIWMDEASHTSRRDFDEFLATNRPELEEFARFEALSEDHGPDWRQWPSKVCKRATPCSDLTFNRERVHFHCWLQWVAHVQVANAHERAQSSGASLGLYLDLAVGARRGGAETWCETNSVADGVSIGAPPDHLSPEGQNWNLAAYAPNKLSQNQYRAFQRVLRASMCNAGILRIDHVLGLKRSFWIPDDGSPGGYIRHPFQSLTAIVAIEAARNNTVVIGEDLGLVPDGFRQDLKSRGLYGYSVLQYEKCQDGTYCQPGALRPNSLACFGTHDTPTIAGFTAARDIEWWQTLGWIEGEQVKSAKAGRKADIASLKTVTSCVGDQNLSDAVHRSLAGSPVAMVSVQVDDLTRNAEAQNLPGTIGEHPNWRRRAAVTVEELSELSALRDTGRIMEKAGRSTCPISKQETA